MVSDAVLEAVSGAIGSVVSLLITYPLKAGGDLVESRATHEVLSAACNGLT